MLKTAIAKTIGLVRPLAPLLLGAMLPLLSLLASANAEAQTEFTPPQVTVHIKANLTREAARPPPSYNWSELALRFTWEQINASVTTCFQKGRWPDTETLACPDQVVPDATLELDGREDLRDSQLCALMGGDVKLQGQQEVCANIDQAGTFCFVGSREVFPCRGLYRRALTCNSFNRPARNPFVCERPCEDEHFACGSGCWSATLEPASEVFPVAPEYAGTVFAVATTLTVGKATFKHQVGDNFELGDFIERISPSGKSFGVTAQVSSSPLSSGSAHAGTLQAVFHCPELSTYKHTVIAEWAFTVTALAQPPTTTLYFESGAGSGGGGRVTVNGITALAFHSGDAALFQVGEDGEISLSSPRPGDGESRTLTMLAYSPEEFLGAMRLTVQAEFRHPFHSDLGAGHCRVPADPTPMRDNDCAASAFADCNALDNALLDSLRNSDGDKSDSDFCRALRNGANVNVFADGDYPMALAATLNRVDIGKILLRDGATIHSDAAERGDALNYAAYAGAVDFARWLIATVGASVNAQSGSGTTPIFHARTSEMVNLLVAEGASVNFVAKTSPHHTTPLDAMLSDYASDTSDENLRQAIDLLADGGEAQCLATHSNGSPRAVVDICPNQALCTPPEVSDRTLHVVSCTLDCPDGYGEPPRGCLASGRFYDDSGELNRLVWLSEKARCEENARSQLSCPSH